MPGKASTSPAGRKRHRALLSAVLAIASSATVLVSCSLPPRLAAVLFEGVPPPGKEIPPEPVVRQPGREAYNPPALPPKVAGAKVEQGPALPDWDALYKKLPREIDASVDWDDALETKITAPSPGIDRKAAEQTVLDYNV